MRDTKEIKSIGALYRFTHSAKKIRNDKGYWSQVDAYVSQHTVAKFSHGVCPECMEKHYLNNSEDDTYYKRRKTFQISLRTANSRESLACKK